MNLLLITADQWRAECLSVARASLPADPASRRARRGGGVLFRRHFAQATPCGPARASLHTGMYALNHRSVTNGTPLDARHSDLAAEARKAGYRPTLFGYTDLSVDPRGRDPARPVASHLRGPLPELRGRRSTCPRTTPPGSPTWSAATAARRASAELFGGALGEPAPYAAEDSETAFLTDAFLTWLERLAGRCALVRASELHQAASAAGGARTLPRAPSPGRRAAAGAGARASRPRRRRIPGSRPSSRQPQSRQLVRQARRAWTRPRSAKRARSTTA